MGPHWRSMVLTAVLALAATCTLSAVAQAGDCKQNALAKLHALAPDGASIYRQVTDKGFFVGWIDCEDSQFALPTAVHESTHRITADRDVFPLVGGGEVARPHAVTAFYPPSRIAGRFKADDYVKTYLKPGESSSATDFLYLLDELNAYSHDLNAAVDLKSLHSDDEMVDHRDGLAAMMAFVAVYIETARDREPATWAGLRQPHVAHVIATLWDHAEAVMASSCGIPNFGTDDRTSIKRFCAPDAQASLSEILGRAPVCPIACLGPQAALSTGE